MRFVSCRDNHGGVAEESACAHSPKPPAMEVCSIVACGQWKVLEWTAVRTDTCCSSSQTFIFIYINILPVAVSLLNDIILEE